MQKDINVLIPQTYEFATLQPQLSKLQTNNHYFGHYVKYIYKTNNIIKNNKYMRKLLILTRKHRNFFFSIAIKHPNFFNLSTKDINVISQTYFHELFFEYLTSKSNSNIFLDDYKIDIFKSNTNFDKFYEEYLSKSSNHFASGWIWFVYNKDTKRIDIYDEQDAKYPIGLLDNTITCIDLWEHSYYTDYSYNRDEYIKNIFMLLNWSKINKRIRTLQRKSHK
jgi:Fe-Mn family superoxide dismutase